MTSNDMVANVFRYVVQLPEESLAGLTIKTLAEKFAVSRGHLSREFSSERGMTLAAFIKGRKLLSAERLLMAAHDVTVKEVAMRLGYADCPYFIALFKEHWGESPGRYRKLAGDQAADPGLFPGTGEALRGRE